MRENTCIPTDRTMKICCFICGFILIWSTDFYKNEVYQINNNSTGFNASEYNRTNIERCNNLSECIYFYKINQDADLQIS